MNWLQVIREWLEFAWPFSKVASWEKAVRFTYLPAFWRLSFRTELFSPHYPGVNLFFVELVKKDARVIVTELNPGMHRKLPWIDDVENLSTVADTFEALIQNVTTLDGVSVTFKVSIVYEIFNVVKAHTEVHDYENSMASLTMIHSARSIRKDNWEVVRSKQDELEQEIKKALHEESKKWGTRIKDVGLTTLVKTEQFNRFQIDK